MATMSRSTSSLALAVAPNVVAEGGCRRLGFRGGSVGWAAGAAVTAVASQRLREVAAAQGGRRELRQNKNLLHHTPAVAITSGHRRQSNAGSRRLFPFSLPSGGVTGMVSVGGPGSSSTKPLGGGAATRTTTTTITASKPLACRFPPPLASRRISSTDSHLSPRRRHDGPSLLSSLAFPREAASVASSLSTHQRQQCRTYLHFTRTLPEDYELPMDTMPTDVDSLMKSDPKKLGFFENYWYWRVRGESTVLNPEELPKKSYKQLARDMGMQVVTPEAEHMVGLLELYEYLKSSPFVGPFGTVENPVIVPSVHTDRVVGCTGGTGDNEHVPLWFRCREGFLYRCGECDQIFMLVRVLYSLPDGKDPFPVDPELDDVFNKKLLENGQKMWNSGDYVHWPVGNLSYKQLFLEGKWGNQVPQQLASTIQRLRE